MHGQTSDWTKKHIKAYEDYLYLYNQEEWVNATGN